MKPPKCRLCGKEHWNNEPHVFASNEANNASNGKTAPKRAVSDRPLHAAMGVQVLGAKSSGSDRVSGGGEVSPPKQRWNREAYNAYMREYMRRKRAA